MRKLIEQCPSCERKQMIVTEQTCTHCGTAVSGQFAPTIFAKLNQDELQFIEIFVKNKGNVKEMERETGWSYWAIRNRLNDVIAALGLDAADSSPPAVDKQASRRAIIAALERGEISVDEATKQLSQLQQ